MLCVGSQVLLDTRLFESTSASTGVMTPRMSRLLAASFLPTACSLARFVSFRSSSTVWPLSIVMTVSIASPPKSFW